MREERAEFSNLVLQSETNPKSKTCGELRRTIENLKWLGLSVMAFVLVVAAAWAQAQQPTKVPRIGYLSAVSSSSQVSRLGAFRDGLRELGYVEGKNIIIEYRYAEERLDRLAALADELVRLKVDVIVSGGPAATRSAKKATVTIPIVMAFDDDPVGSGFVASLARPRGNITGLSSHSPEISGKQLELLRETVPQLSRIAMLGTSTNPGNTQALRETKLAAEAFKVQLQYLEVQSPTDIDAAFKTARNWRADGVLVLPGAIFSFHRRQIVELAVRDRLPAIYPRPEDVEAGGLMTYGASLTDLDRRSATYVDKILKGAKPAELPVEQPTKFELVINLKAATQIGLTIPDYVLYRADKIIK